MLSATEGTENKSDKVPTHLRLMAWSEERQTLNKQVNRISAAWKISRVKRNSGFRGM